MAIAAAAPASMAAILAVTGANTVDIPPVGTFDEMKANVWYPKYRELVEVLNFRVLEKLAYIFGSSIADNWFLTALRLVDGALEHDLKQVLQEQFVTPGKLERWEKSVQFVDFLPIEDREVPGRVLNLQFLNTCRLIGCTMTDGAKIRFSCSSCAHNWTSMKGRITFWIVFSERDITISPLASSTFPTGLSPTPTPIGTIFPTQLLFKQGANVFFKLYSQDCSQCPCKQIEPKWYQEEIKKVLDNFFVQLHNAFYKGLFPWDGKFNHERRVGNPNKPHPSASCDACRLGICAQSQAR